MRVLVSMCTMTSMIVPEDTHIYNQGTRHTSPYPTFLVFPELLKCPYECFISQFSVPVRKMPGESDP